MAQFKKIKNKDGSIKQFITSATFNGKEVNITYSVSKLSDATNKERREKEAEEAAKTRHGVVKKLEESKKLGFEPDPATLRMLEALPDLCETLKNKGVLNCGACITLEELCNRFIKHNESQGLALSTIEQRFYTARRLCEFFGADTKVDAITKQDAETFDDSLGRLVKAGKMAAAHRSGIIKRTKTIFNYAIKNEIIAVNPFVNVKAGKQSNRYRMWYVSEKETERILEACEHMENGAEWAVVTALARFQGFRVPSESRALKWDDVDFIGGKFIKTKDGVPIPALRITAQKTKTTRIMPLFPRTKEILQRLRDEQERAGTLEECPFVLRKVRMNTNPGTTFKKIVFRAGVEEYPKPLQNLRASAATDVRKDHGRAAESEWVGHDAAIADEHYDMVISGDLLKAAGIAPKASVPDTSDKDNESNTVNKFGRLTIDEVLKSLPSEELTRAQAFLEGLAKGYEAHAGKGS